MKVLHISTYDSGGAAKACNRLHQRLHETDVESDVLVLHKGTDQPRYHAFLEHNWSLWHQLRHSLGARWNRRKRHKISAKMDHHARFSLPGSPYRLNDHPLVRHADIIHLHWVGDFMDYHTFFQNLGKPIVWTLHDTNPFNGLFHYPLDADNNHNLATMDEKVAIEKRSALHKAENLSFICLCRWMMEELEKAELPEHAMNHVPNGIDTERFSPLDREVARKHFQIPLDKKVVLFAADDISDHRKGFHLMDKITRHLSDETTLLCTMGKATVANDKHFNLGYLDKESDIVKAYAAADLFVLPSLEDNLPNTALEAMACGVPVISFNVGGLPDIIDDRVNGELINPYNTDSFAQRILEIVNQDSYRKDLAQNARKKVKEVFDIEKMVTAHAKIYKNVLRRAD